MPKICYEPKDFNAEHESLIGTAESICEEYEAQGLKLTLRQIYYQFVARGLIENAQKSYKRLGAILSEARLAGRIDWDMIEDRTRELEKLQTWDSPADILEAVSHHFRYDRWANQPVRFEVRVEKDALTGVIEPVCQKWHVPFTAGRGNTSQSELWGTAQRYVQMTRDGQEVRVLYLGDHDPNGIDISRDTADRLEMFCRGAAVSLDRIALNMDQVDRYKPPPFPAKITDSRYAGYVEKFGHDCWELDALEPKVLATLIEGKIKKQIDMALWEEAADREANARARLRDLANEWEDVK